MILFFLLLLDRRSSLLGGRPARPEVCAAPGIDARAQPPAGVQSARRIKLFLQRTVIGLGLIGTDAEG